MSPTFVFGLLFVPSALALLFSFFNAPTQYSYLYSKSFILTFFSISFFSSFIIASSTFIFRKFSLRVTSLFLPGIKTISRLFPARYVNHPFYSVALYLSLQLLERYLIGFAVSSQGINFYNESLSNLPLGFKALQLLVFIFAIFSCYRFSFINKINSSVYLTLLGLFSLITLKRLLLLVCLFYSLFIYFRKIKIKSVFRLLFFFRLSNRIILFIAAAIFVVTSFYYLFGFVDNYRNLRQIGFSASDVIFKGWSIFSYYIQMPITNFASYFFHDPSCDISFLSTFIPNRFLNIDTASCVRNYQIYHGTALGFWGKIFASSLIVKILYLLSTSFSVSLLTHKAVSIYSSPFVWLYSILFFQSNLFLNPAFSLPLVVVSVFFVFFDKYHLSNEVRDL